MKLDFDNISEEIAVYEAFGVEGKEADALSDAYLELFELVGKDAMLKIYKRCNGEKLVLPKRLYRQEFIADLASQTGDRRERAKIARAGGYSASTVEDLLGKRSKKEK